MQKTLKKNAAESELAHLHKNEFARYFVHKFYTCRLKHCQGSFPTMDRGLTTAFKSRTTITVVQRSGKCE